jgi:hypothetical protein
MEKRGSLGEDIVSTANGDEIDANNPGPTT